jgi:cytochrome c-type biogenesis protein CcmH
MAAILLVGFVATAAPAETPLPPAALANTALADPAQEAQARALMATLRCLVCQGQSIADSDADLAGDMRALVRERIRAGERPEAIRRWLIARYGDYVSYDPPWGWATAPLWLAPLALIGLGAWLARASFRRRAR